VRAERKAVGCCSIIRLRSRTRLSFTRSWSHIREDGTDVVVLWFVRRGRLQITHDGGRSVAGAGDFAITRSMKPFTMKCETDRESLHEVLHVIVPTHIFRGLLPREIKACFAVAGSVRELAIAERIFAEVFEDGDELAPATEQVLVDSALAVVTAAIGGREECLALRQSLREQRLQEVLRYIDLHLSDPNLSATSAARACGISARYLSALLKDNGTPFSELIWDKRVKIAGGWLASSKPNEISIAEIAFQVGFKSPAHFSRMFKRVFKQGPREYRSACLERPGSVAGPGTLQ